VHYEGILLILQGPVISSRNTKFKIIQNMYILRTKYIYIFTTDISTKALTVGKLYHKLSLHIWWPTCFGECSISAGKPQLKEMQA